MNKSERQSIKDYKSEGNVLTLGVNSPSVLIVEDDMTYEPIWNYILEKISPKIKSVWATNASEAENILANSGSDGEVFDLIISDIFLSGTKTGLDLWFKYGEPNENMIIVSSIDYAKLLKYLGPTKNPPLYLQKPLEVSQCVNIVKEVLSFGR